MIENELISVVVVSFNSSKFIIETLESIKNQTYHKIELIVSDDCSNDNTCDIVKQWIEDNGTRFVRAELLTSEFNSGVSGNMNRGVQYSHGNWIKTIAGDDLLTPNAIEDFVMYVTTVPDVKMCVCSIEPFSAGKDVDITIINSYSRYFTLMNEPYEKQLHRVCREMVFPGPGYFYSRSLYDKIGGFSEEYGNFEEWPFVYKVLRAGEKIFALQKNLVKYRVSEASLSRSRENYGLENPNYFFSGYKFFFDGPYHDLLQQRRYFEALHIALIYHARKNQYKTHNSFLSRMMLYLTIYLSPYTYIKKMGLIK